MGPAARLMHDPNGASRGAAALAFDGEARGVLTGFSEGKPRNGFGGFDRLAIAASLLIVSAAYFYAAISRSIADHFWMDEVLAVSAASQSSLAGVWRAIWAGTDFSP